MKILLYENLPIDLNIKIHGNHEIYTVQGMHWSGKQNGELLNLLNENNFNILITGDKNIKFQQNIDRLNVTIIVLNSPNNRLSTLVPYISEANRLLLSEMAFGIIEINF